MFSNTQKKLYYKALLDKNPDYDGLFFVGVKTTGVFCRSTCPARKPKFENCEFYTTAKEALLASFRPCQRCKPLSHPNEASPTIQRLVAAIEENPEKRWKDEDFRQLSVDASTARRQFKNRFGMTFVEYARSRRIGLAMKHIRSGSRVIDAQVLAGYESESGFRDAFSAIMGDVPSKNANKVLYSSWLDTKLGPMLAIADDDGLYLLEFVERRGLEREIERLRSKLKAAIIPGTNLVILSIKRELDDYFSVRSFKFNTPIHLLGTDFQKEVWHVLQAIPAGTTRSYRDIAEMINKPSAVRAVANANGANQLALIIPCHRVINANNELGGYGGGIVRKKWLIEHEKGNR